MAFLRGVSTQRILAHFESAALDARLAAGEPPDHSELLTLRARALVRPSTRSALAGTWRTLLADARSPHRRGLADARVRPCRRHVLDAASEIDQLCQALTAAGPVPARGVALAEHLIHDGTGPVYNGHSDDDLQELLLEAAHYADARESLFA